MSSYGLDGDLVDIATRYPERIAEILKDLYSQSASAACEFVSSILDFLKTIHDLSQAKRGAIFDSKLQDVLLDILLQEQFYLPAAEFNDELPHERARLMEACLNAFTYLILCISHVPSNPRTYDAHTASLVQKLSQLWPALWSHRRTALDGSSNELQDRGCPCFSREKLIPILAFYGKEYQRRMGKLPPLSHHHLHLLLYCWIQSYHKDDTAMVATGGLIYYRRFTENYERTGVAEDEFYQFYDEVIVTETDAERLQARFIREMKKPTNLNDDLETLLVVLAATLPRCRALQDLEVGGRGPRLLKHLVYACQRQLCMGKPNNEEVVGLGLCTIVFLMVNTSTKAVVRKALMDNMETLNLMPLISRILPTVVAADGDGRPVKDLVLIIQFYISPFGTMMRSSQDHPFRDVLIRKSRGFWLPTLRELRRIVPSRREMMNTRDRMIALWVSYGRRLGMSESQAAWDAAAAAAAGPDPVYAIMCEDESCLCHGQKPDHRMRVCKGCWQTFYCCDQCQARDWNKRHKDLCHQLRVRCSETESSELEVTLCPRGST